MTKKITVLNTHDSANPTVQADIVFVQGKGCIIKRGTEQEVTPVYQQVLSESNKNYREFNKSNLQVSGKTPQEYNSI